MSSREITLWLDERWYDAIRGSLKGETVEEHLETVLDELCNQLPEREYQQISAEIHAERMADRQAAEAAKQYTAFHITGQGEDGYWQLDRPLEFMDAARMLRSYLRNERGTASFLQMLHRPEQITAERFEELARLRMDNTGQVAGAYHLDFERQRMDALNIMDGWQCFRMEDVSAAAYHAFRKRDFNREAQWSRFLDKLEGRALTCEPEEHAEAFLTGSRRLRPEEISFADEIVQNDHLLEFYMEVVFDADEVFGTNVCTTENDDFLNIYANYNMESGCVSDLLEVYVMRGTGEEQSCQYRMSAEERTAVLDKMEEYCRQQMGRSIGDCCREYHMEQQTPAMGGMEMK